jgi:hypothetical protein
MPAGYQTTRPKGEQVLFTSSRTGDHVLDQYLEDAELGNKTLSELLLVLFDEDGGLRNVIFGIRLGANREIEIRVGNTAETSDWVSTGVSMFRWRGAYAEGASYQSSDWLTIGGMIYVVVTDHVAGPAPDMAKFIALNPYISTYMVQLLAADDANECLGILGFPAFPASDGVKRQLVSVNGVLSWELPPAKASRFFYSMI